VQKKGDVRFWQAPRSGGNPPGSCHFVRFGKSALMGRSMSSNHRMDLLNFHEYGVLSEKFSVLAEFEEQCSPWIA
jgi:hypothetical protein